MKKAIMTALCLGMGAFCLFKTLPKERQEELIRKTNEAIEDLKNKGYDVAYLAADKVGEFSADKTEKYADQIHAIKEFSNSTKEQVTPYLEKSRDAIQPYVDRLASVVDDLTTKLNNDNAFSEEDEIKLELALSDLEDELKNQENNTDQVDNDETK